MQTFAPLPSMKDSIKILDNKRLGKQRVEAVQILVSLLEVPKTDGSISKGWRWHPATALWEGYEYALARYTALCCLEWRLRGFTDNLWPVPLLLVGRLTPRRAVKASDLESVKRFAAYTHLNGSLQTRKVKPPWWGYEPLHSSHRANLLRKDPEYYGKFGWTEEPRKGYHWYFSE
jgi:hypothetical protein|tara:strand:- start:408 stop:932 length:525 start_codon:yes stop_codon:yes gene_type:complete